MLALNTAKILPWAGPVFQVLQRGKVSVFKDCLAKLFHQGFVTPEIAKVNIGDLRLRNLAAREIVKATRSARSGRRRQRPCYQLMIVMIFLDEVARFLRLSVGERSEITPLRGPMALIASNRPCLPLAELIAYACSSVPIGFSSLVLKPDFWLISAGIAAHKFPADPFEQSLA